MSSEFSGRLRKPDEVKILLHRGGELLRDWALKKWVLHERGVGSVSGRVFLVAEKAVDYLRSETDLHEPEIEFTRYRMGRSRQFELTPKAKQEMLAFLGK